MPVSVCNVCLLVKNYGVSWLTIIYFTLCNSWVVTGRKKKKESMGKVKIKNVRKYLNRRNNEENNLIKMKCMRRQKKSRRASNLLDWKSDNNIFKPHLFLIPLYTSNIIIISRLGFASVYCLVYSIHHQNWLNAFENKSLIYITLSVELRILFLK